MTPLNVWANIQTHVSFAENVHGKTNGFILPPTVLSFRKILTKLNCNFATWNHRVVFRLAPNVPKKLEPISFLLLQKTKQYKFIRGRDRSTRIHNNINIKNQNQMFKLTISNMQNSDSRSFEFNDYKTAMSRFNEHMDANNINEVDFFDDGFDMWFKDQTAVGEYLVAGCGGIGHDVRIQLEAIKAFTPVHSNSISHVPIIQAKLRELGARRIGGNDDKHMDFWQFENRMFIIYETWSSIKGHRFDLYCSMEFDSLNSAIEQIETICRIQTFEA